MDNISPEDAKEILAADIDNIVGKVKKGKPLSSAERARVQACAAGSTDTLAKAKTVVELANALGVTRQMLGRWRRMKGAPKPSPNGTHDVSAWRDFVRARGLKGSVSGEECNIEALKSRKLLAEVEKREMEVAIKRGEYVKTEEVRHAWHVLVGKAIALLRAKFENELPPLLSGMDAQGIREEGCKAIDEVCQLLNQGGEP